jgi:transcription initiation factor TFIIIB Brf1 subunit/transcription initiation factor TFIIB
MDILRCKNHPYAATVEDAHAGDVICSHCGLVVGER